jgi:7 transmembrane sweet-taste receptor of 3 GCPR
LGLALLWGILIYNLIDSNLLAKTYRIFKIFNNIRVTSLVIRDTDLLIFSGVVILGEVILLCVYTFIVPFPEPVVIQSTSVSLLKFIECKCPNSAIQTGLTIAIIAYNVILVLAGCVIAYLTRNVDSAFNESQYIAVTMYIYLLTAIILIPLYYTAGDSQSSIDRQFVLRVVGVVLSMYFTLGALFVPKIVAVEQDKKARREAEKEKGGEGTRITDISTTGGSTLGAPGSYPRGGRSATMSTSQSGSEITNRRTTGSTTSSK